jgi:hypothetical protein
MMEMKHILVGRGGRVTQICKLRLVMEEEMICLDQKNNFQKKSRNRISCLGEMQSLLLTVILCSAILVYLFLKCTPTEEPPSMLALWPREPVTQTPVLPRE